MTLVPTGALLHASSALIYVISNNIAAFIPKVSWYATVGGPGAQAPGALAAQPNGSAVYAVGSAWSAAQVCPVRFKGAKRSIQRGEPQTLRSTSDNHVHVTW